MIDRNPELEAEIARNPDDPSPYQVYADWLSDRGDPRGELISLSIALERAPGEPAITRRLHDLHLAHDADWLGGLARAPDGVSLTWRRGFVDEIRVGDDEPDSIDLVESYVTVREATRDALAARMVRKLTLGAFADDDGEPSWAPVTLAMVEHGVPETLEELRYERGSYWDISSTYLDRLDQLYPQLARLERLYIEIGHIELGEIVLPALRAFEVYTGGFTGDNMRSVLGASWPRLERLILRFGNSPDHGGTTVADDVLPLFGSPRLPNLHQLALANCGYVDDLIAPLATSELLGRLDTLDLSMGLLGDPGAQIIVDRADRFGHLARLDVSRSYLSPDMASRLHAIFGDRVEIGDQRTADVYNGRVYRYCQIGE